ncbi:TetR/AcrR family transcriptional regulator [Burkholderia sp. WSM2230]|uniref:TetR/AcrR family transcriptional regulator n=1 Tax=Burkholderia sp. WSM2230 TaxID=944435 RepID=UPI000472A4AC|nr:TetR/AcrR family transcriptional regulator [Burkholderia sp. WSM2230]
MERLTFPSEAIFDVEDLAPSRKRGNRQSRVPEIIEVSINVLVAVGHAGYTINRVASEAGIRLSTLQHYFSNREELLRATIQAVADKFRDSFERMVKDQSRSPRERLDGIVDDAFEELAKPGLALAIFECWGVALHEPFAHELVTQLRKEYKAMFAGLVAELNPTLSPEESALRGSLLLSSWEGLATYLRWNDDTPARLAALRKAVKVIWAGISNAGE